ncbi:sensor domain-containing diguanylate cyclase [Methylobacter sp.]|uniref:sensor domain-containing diguanylate cyclase n=1 Tax=Methylobacter sp. TaxID=2051955 RepID=UPI002FDE1E9C
MRLSAFILNNIEEIIKEWEVFAKTFLPEAQNIDKEQLRDHLDEILRTIAADLARPETVHEQIEKSKGQSLTPNRDDTAATIHGAYRRLLGFSLNSMVAEYRALRASVIRLWLEENPERLSSVIYFGDLIRFNEAIDQSITEAALSYSTEREHDSRMFETIMTSCHDLISSFDLEGRFLYANKALTELLGLTLDKLVGKNHFDLDVPVAAELKGLIEQTIRNKKPVCEELPYTPGSGTEEWYEYIFTPVLGNEGNIEAVACIGRKVTERKASEDNNWYKANYDELTGLPNRSLFFNRLEEYITQFERAGRPLALLFIDLDLFKEVNDRFGHETGDSLLQKAAERIHSCVRQSDTAARLGGDEFTVILLNLPKPEQVEIVVEKIRQRLAEPFQIDQHTVQISASIGVALYPQDASIVDQLVHHADVAMYASKKAGGNQFIVFSPHLTQTSGRQLGR